MEQNHFADWMITAIIAVVAIGFLLMVVPWHNPHASYGGECGSASWKYDC